MAVTIHVNGKSNSLVHKGSMGIAKSTLPDVCKTPTPGGPVPIPYPVIVSMSSDLKKGSKKVKFDGGNSAAIKGSEFSRCTGDEPGTVGGIKSSTNMKEATWILYSFDVKIEGKNACRLSDKMMMNHGNTACLSGCGNIPVAGDGAEHDVSCAVKECDNASYDLKSTPEKDSKGRSGNRCKVLGRKKHDCVKEKLDGKEDEGILSEGSFDMEGHLPASTGSPSIIMSQQINPGGVSPWYSAFGKMRKAVGGGSIKGLIRRPDVVLVGDPGNTVIDLKFPCPGKVKRGKKTRGYMPSADVPSASYMTEATLYAYKLIAGQGKVKTIAPQECKQEICP